MTTEISTSSTTKVKKSKKTTTSSEISSPTPVPETTPSETVSVAEPVVVTKQKKSKSSSSVDPVVEVTVSTEPSEVQVSESEQVVTLEVTEESNTEILFNKLINQFQDIQSVMKTLHSNLKVLQKEVSKERKESKKKESKIKKKSGKKKSPSGFAKPAPITDDLASFLGLGSGVELARTDVTTKIIAYVKEHGLQNPANKKQIVPDEKLAKILLVPDSEVVTFFNLQTYLKKHFLPSVSTAEVTV
jgi:chromatin remodeling complex protein RSC6